MIRGSTPPLAGDGIRTQGYKVIADVDGETILIDPITKKIKLSDSHVLEGIPWMTFNMPTVRVVAGSKIQLFRFKVPHDLELSISAWGISKSSGVIDPDIKLDFVENDEIVLASSYQQFAYVPIGTLKLLSEKIYCVVAFNNTLVDVEMQAFCALVKIVGGEV